MKNLFKSSKIMIIAGLVFQSASIFALPTAELTEDGTVDIGDSLYPFIPYDSKTFHGSECQALEGSHVSDFNYYANRVYNIGSDTSTITCPIVRDNTTNTNGTYGTEIYVNNVAGQKLSCKLYSYSSHGVLVESSYKSTTAGGNQTLYPNVNLSKNMGNYSLVCELPKGASLYSYKVKEFLKTDYYN